MRRTVRVVTALAVLGIGATPSLAGEQHYRIIVHRSRQITQLTNDRLADYFLRRATKWSDGTSVMPVDLTMKSEVRRSFTEDTLAQTVNGVLAYWERQIAGGRRMPPVVKGSDADVVAFIKANPGAIGYVSDETVLVPDVREVAILRIDDRAADVPRDEHRRSPSQLLGSR